MPNLPVDLGQGIVTLVLEIVGVGAAIVVLRGLLRRYVRADRALFAATAVVVGVLALVLAADDLASSSVGVLDQTEQQSGGAIPGIDHCLIETGAEEQIPFVNWLRSRLPVGAVYELTSDGQTNGWCQTLTLLPSLPAYGNDRPGWLIAMGDIPPSLQARIKDHDPSVQVYAHNLVLARLQP